MSTPTKLKKWQLLKSEDISPSKWFPLEKRSYQMPNGTIVDDFYVTTLQDSVHIIPITKDGKIVLIRMYKQGEDNFVVQFPAGRYEEKHTNHLDAAVRELEEETGIRVTPEQLQPVGEIAVMTTKSSEHTHIYLAQNVEFNSRQKLDDNEEIEVLCVTPAELEEMIVTGEIIEGLIIADWFLVKKKFPHIFP